MRVPVLLSLVACGAIVKTSSLQRDPKRELAAYDRSAIGHFLGSSKVMKMAYIKGDCTLAPDLEQRAFCEGNYGALKNPDLIAFSKGTSTQRCAEIRAPDLRLFCEATYRDWAYPYPCDEIKQSGMRNVCINVNKKKPSAGGGGGTSTPTEEAPPTEEQDPNCKPDGAEAHPNDCCSKLTKLVNTTRGTTNYSKSICCSTPGEDGCN